MSQHDICTEFLCISQKAPRQRRFLIFLSIYSKKIYVNFSPATSQLPQSSVFIFYIPVWFNGLDNQGNTVATAVADVASAWLVGVMKNNRKTSLHTFLSSTFFLFYLATSHYSFLLCLIVMEKNVHSFVWDECFRDIFI